MPERHLWERQEGESPKAFEAFEYYQRLPPEQRSLQRAWEQYWSRPGNARARYKENAGKPYGHWTRWSGRWRWPERASAWDDELAALARDLQLDRELKARLSAQEEQLRQQRLMREEARAARAVGRRILIRILQGVDAGQLDQMSVSDLLPHLAKASTLLEVGQKLDRLFSGEPKDTTHQETDARETVRKLVRIMQHFVPEESWDALAEELRSLEADQ